MPRRKMHIDFGEPTEFPLFKSIALVIHLPLRALSGYSTLATITPSQEWMLHLPPSYRVQLMGAKNESRED